MFLAVTLVRWMERFQPITFSSITIFEDFAFIVQFKHKQHIRSWLYLICVYYG